MTSALAATALHLVFSVVLPCEMPPGAIIAAIRTTGGDGNPVTLQWSGGDNTDFALNAASLVVSAAGIAPVHCGSTRSVTVTASQN